MYLRQMLLRKMLPAALAALALFIASAPLQAGDSPAVPAGHHDKGGKEPIVEWPERPPWPEASPASS